MLLLSRNFYINHFECPYQKMNHLSMTKVLVSILHVSIILALAILSPSCKKDIIEIPVTSPSPVPSAGAEEHYQEAFSRALSRAVSKSKELRALLKEEALKEFDRNSDVLYHLVKWKELAPGLTVRKILLQYWDQGQDQFQKMEERLPLLNIYLPDLSLFGLDSSKDWDIHSSDVGVALSEGRLGTTLFIDGDSVTSLVAGEIPTIPTFVVNTNKRVRVRSSARALGGEPNFSYAFLDVAFANGGGQQAVRGYADLVQKILWEKPQSEDDNYIMVTPRQADSKYMHLPELKEAFDEALKQGTLGELKLDIQRAVAYYGKDTISSNKEINEFLYRFKINPSAYSLITDDSDPKIQGEYSFNPFRGEFPLPMQALIERCWTSGDFVFVFSVHTPLRNGKAEVSTITIPVAPKDLFYMRPQVQERKSFWTWKYRVYVRIIPSALEAKWVYPHRDGLRELIRISDSWDLSRQGLSKKIFISEFDPTNMKKKDRTLSSEFFVESDVSIGAKLKESLGLSLSASGKASGKRVATESLSVSYTDIADDLGTIDLSFYDPIFRKGLENGKAELANVSNGAVAITIIPAKGYKN